MPCEAMFSVTGLWTSVPSGASGTLLTSAVRESLRDSVFLVARV